MSHGAGDRPRLRGVLHQHAFFAALAAGAVLVAAADGARARVGATVYAIGLAGLLGTSALYHRVTWSAAARRWMRRLDHAMIFVLIAATTTPVALLVLDDPLRTVLLAVTWGSAVAGVLLELLWPAAPKWFNSAVYCAVGLCGFSAFPSLAGYALAALVLMVAGGVLYAAGAVVYAIGRPDPRPAVFGYHEVWHSFVVGAGACHYVAVLLTVGRVA